MGITTKQRAYLRSLANELQPVLHIGKEGINEGVIMNASETIDKHELIKVALQRNAPLETREACNELCDAINAEPVQCIGSKFVIYKRAKEAKIELP